MNKIGQQDEAADHEKAEAERENNEERAKQPDRYNVNYGGEQPPGRDAVIELRICFRVGQTAHPAEPVAAKTIAHPSLPLLTNLSFYLASEALCFKTRVRFPIRDARRRDARKSRRQEASSRSLFCRRMR